MIEMVLIVSTTMTHLYRNLLTQKMDTWYLTKQCMMGKIIQCYAYGCFCFRDPVIFAEGKTELNPAKGKPAQPDFNIYGIMGNHKTCKT